MLPAKRVAFHVQAFHVSQTVRRLAKNACRRYQKNTYFQKMSKLGAYTHSMQCSRFSAEKVRPLARTFQVPVRRYKNLIRDISDFCKVSLEQGTCISISFQQYHFELET